MKVFSVVGITQSGKTTTIENIIKELRKRRYSVGSVKEIHFEAFAIDTEGTNTYRHKEAGSQLVTAMGNKETDILFQEKLPVRELLKFYDHDFVVLEGVEDQNIPKIVSAHDEEGIYEKLDDLSFAISGRISNVIDEFNGLPAISSLDNIGGLVDLIEEKVYSILPDFPEECCKDCGYNCQELGSKILKGDAKREECTISNTNVKLWINDKEIDMVPFVQDILYNNVLAIVKELDGYKEGKEIKIKIE